MSRRHSAQQTCQPSHTRCPPSRKTLIPCRHHRAHTDDQHTHPCLRIQQTRSPYPLHTAHVAQDTHPAAHSCLHTLRTLRAVTSASTTPTTCHARYTHQPHRIALCQGQSPLCCPQRQGHPNSPHDCRSPQHTKPRSQQIRTGQGSQWLDINTSADGGQQASPFPDGVDCGIDFFRSVVVLDFASRFVEEQVRFPAGLAVPIFFL